MLLDVVTPGRSDRAIVDVSLRSPWVPVEDADIRGFLDGEVKYPFNQGTAYHMRLGRRYGGAYHNRYELKRSLVRWYLPSWQNRATVVGATVGLYVEPFLNDSPLKDGRVPLPLHVIAYPVEQTWQQGNGGIGLDSFSDAADGEVNWLSAAVGVEEWQDPGALPISHDEGPGPYAVHPLALGVLDCSDCRIELTGARLTAAVAEAFAGGEPFDVLLKLDDAQEDRWGTEFGVLTSDYGHAWDRVNKGPELNMAVEVVGDHEHMAEEVIVESGGEHVLPPVVRPSGPMLIAARFEVPTASPADVMPTLWIRGGRGEPDLEAPWRRMVVPIEEDWTWFQVKVSSRLNEVDWGKPVTIGIRETWVRPEPRDQVRPTLHLISPTGKRLKVIGEPADDLSYEMRFVPQEFGLWRYAWSFRPVPEADPDAHAGEGLFYVTAMDPQSVKAAVIHLKEIIGREGIGDHAVEIEGLVREAKRKMWRKDWQEAGVQHWLDCARAVVVEPASAESSCYDIVPNGG